MPDTANTSSVGSLPQNEMSSTDQNVQTSKSDKFPPIGDKQADFQPTTAPMKPPTVSSTIPKVMKDTAAAVSSPVMVEEGAHGAVSGTPAQPAAEVALPSWKPKLEYLQRSGDLTAAMEAASPKQIENLSPKSSSMIAKDGQTETVESITDLAGSNRNDNAIKYPALTLVEDVFFRLTAMSEIPPAADILTHDVNLLHSAHHDNAFSVLGPHEFIHEGQNCIVVRCWVKDAATISLRLVGKTGCIMGTKNEWVPMTRRCDWLFQLAVKVEENDTNGKWHSPSQPALSLFKPLYEMKIGYLGDMSGKEYILRDAYSFGLLLPAFDLTLFQSGSCWHVDNLMGSHIVSIEDAPGVRFSVWAPNAKYVSVVGDFNQWDGRAHPMRKRIEFGVWELFIPNIPESGHKYGYKIHTSHGTDIVKIDPYAQEFENPPAHASVISACDDAYRPEAERFEWTDRAWLTKRGKLGDEDMMRRQPISIYEVHLPSWMRGDGNSYLSYRELAHRLVAHIKKMHFTHVEFLPVAHHPFEGSWGYQVSGLYAPYSRQGNADDLKFLINHLHENDIGVFIDFVPAHFVKDDWGLVHYDGEPCFEYTDPREGENKSWGTMVFNFRRNEVRSFLLGAAYHWLRRYHVDGLRIDAVSTMLYRDYLKEPGEWVPNEFGGNANIEAIALLQELNWVVHKEFVGVFTMAEEATSWPGVTDKKKGLGFDAKWDLGWMNDTLSYLCNPPTTRPDKHNKLTFRGMYVAHENWILPLSHDEVVSGKGSLLDKCGFMGAPFHERLQTLKALYGYQIALPGRPLLFMGGEFGQGREWKELRSLDWHESEQSERKQMMELVADLLKAYQTEKPLHAGDDEPWNFKWTDCNNAEDCIIAFIRSWQEWYNDVLVIVNFSGKCYNKYPVGVPHGGKWKVLINSDDWRYGGCMKGPGNGTEVQTTQGGRLGWPYCLWIDVPPFSVLYLKAPQPTAEEIAAAAAATAQANLAAEKAASLAAAHVAEAEKGEAHQPEHTESLKVSKTDPVDETSAKKSEGIPKAGAPETSEEDFVSQEDENI